VDGSAMAAVNFVDAHVTNAVGAVRRVVTVSVTGLGRFVPSLSLAVWCSLSFLT